MAHLPSIVAIVPQVLSFAQEVSNGSDACSHLWFHVAPCFLRFTSESKALSFSKVTAGLGEDGCVYSALTTRMEIKNLEAS